MQNKYIIIITIIIIIISLFTPYNMKNVLEGLGGPTLDSIKVDEGVSEVELQDKLSKLYSSVREHERRLSLLDNSYNKHDIQQQNYNEENIARNSDNLLRKIKRQDIQLSKITKPKQYNTYIPSTTLNRLLDNSLILPYYNELIKLHEYVEKPLMGPPSTDPKELGEIEGKYKANGMLDHAKAAYETKVEYETGIKKQPDNTPKISMIAVKNLVQDAKIKYIDEIVLYQETALKEYENINQKYIANMYGVA